MGARKLVDHQCLSKTKKKEGKGLGISGGAVIIVRQGRPKGK